MELSQHFFGFQNWIEDHIGPDINLNEDDENHKDEQNIGQWKWRIVEFNRFKLIYFQQTSLIKQ